jgi:iron complex outermembrane receptor protein
MVFLSIGILHAQENKTQSSDSLQKKQEETLKEIIVLGYKKEFVKVEADKTTVNISENPMVSTGNAFEAIRRLPGVFVAPDGSILLNGKAVQIQMDGIPSNISGEDLQKLLTGLPAAALEKAELIYNPGANYDANASGSIINLVTSTKKAKGISGNFNINYNFNKYQKPSPQVMFNGKQNNLSWNLMTGYNYIDSERKSVNTSTFTGYPQNSNTTDNLTLNTNRNFYFRTGLNYKINKKSSVLFNYNTNIANDDADFNVKTKIIELDKDEKIISKDINNIGLTNDKNSNHEFVLQYKRKLDTIGSTMDAQIYTSLFHKNPITNTYVENNRNNGNLDFGLNTHYAKVDFEVPLKKWDTKLTTGTKFNIIDLTNNGTYNFSNSSSAINFNYYEQIFALYGKLQKKIKKFSLTAGLRFEDFFSNRNTINDNELATKTTFTNKNFEDKLFPEASILYELNNNINFTANYNRKVQQPSYWQLDPNNGQYFDQFNASRGNPDLKAVFINNYEFRVSAFQMINFGVNYTIEKNPSQFLNEAISGNSNNPIVNSTNTQFKNDRESFGAYASFPIPLDLILKGKDEFKKRMSDFDKMNSIYISAFYGKTNIPEFELPFKNTGFYNINANSTIQLPWSVKMNLGYFFLPKGVYQVYKLDKPIQQFDISFQRDFLDKNLKIGFHIFDVFNQNEVNAVIASNTIKTNFCEKMDSRVFRISLSWNFGKIKMQDETQINAEKVNTSGGGFMK